MLDRILDYLFPKHSAGGEEGEWLTASDRSMLQPKPVYEDQAVLRGRGLTALDAIWASMPYCKTGPIAQAVHLLKYRHVPDLAADLAEVMVQAEPRLPPEAVLCPVPLHWTRRFARGFNQAELLADELGRRTGKPVRHVLRRARATGSQARRTRVERLVALEDAFRFKGESAPACVVLIDDLSTTGATLDFCAKTLKAHGVSRVEGWVFAHG